MSFMSRAHRLPGVALGQGAEVDLGPLREGDGVPLPENGPVIHVGKELLEDGGAGHLVAAGGEAPARVTG